MTRKAFAAVMLLAGVLATPALAQGQGGCQTTIMGDGSQVTMCKDAGGKWRTVDTPATPAGASGTFPARAEVVYAGNWSAQIATGKKITLNNLRLSSLLDQAVKSTQKTPVGGDMRIVATFTGSSFTAFAYGKNFIREQFSGTIANGTCRMVGPGDTMEGPCGKNGFSGTIRGKTRQGQSVSGTFETALVQIVDLDERARQQAAAEKARQAEIAAAEARLRAAPAAGAALTAKLEGFVRADAQGWAFNHYDGGSVRNVKIVDGSVKKGDYTLRGDYTYNGGTKGWVLAKMTGTSLDCIQFHDAVVGCRGLRTAADGRNMRNLAVGMVSGGGSGPGRAEGPSIEEQMANDNSRRQAEADREPKYQAPPITPIGGDTGLYGSDHSCCQR